MTEQQYAEQGLAEFRKREASGYVFPTASNAFVQGYVAGAQRETEIPEDVFMEMAAQQQAEELFIEGGEES